MDSARVPWETGSLTLWSLWDMLTTYNWNLVQYTDNLTWIRQSLEARLLAAQSGMRLDAINITDNDRKNLTVQFETYRRWLEDHALTASLDESTQILEELTYDDPDIHNLIDGLKHFNKTLENELRRRMFVYLPPEDAKFYDDPAGFFPRTSKAFPSAQDDIREACRCHALNRYTASVYHSMAIAQVGLYALADNLGVSFSYSISLAEWNNVISAIEDKVKPMREGPRSDQKDADVTFYSGCASQFRYFKDAWRNHVGHMRDTYDRDQAHSILVHVRDFTERLSERISEKVTP